MKRVAQNVQYSSIWLVITQYKEYRTKGVVWHKMNSIKQKEQYGTK